LIKKGFFLLQIDPEIGSRLTSRYFLFKKGLKTAFHEIKSKTAPISA